MPPERLRGREFLDGGGEMGARTREFEWASTPVGPPESWSSSLRAAVSILLTSRHPMFLWWGPDLVQFYNDAYRPSLGDDRHPGALGARGRKFWAEIWPAIGPQIEAVMTRGEPTWNEDHLVPISRNGRLEEVYWTYGYSPVRDDDGSIGGTLVVVQEQTRRVIGERRLRTLRDIAALAFASRTEAQSWTAALEALAANPRDLPWAVLYAVGDDGAGARLIGHTGPDPALGARLVAEGDGPWPLAQVIEGGTALLLPDVRERVGDVPGSTSPEPVQQAWLVPVRRPGSVIPCGVLVAALSPHLGFDADYRNFLTLAVDQIATGIGAARTSDEERRRAESLAELDRAKTAFFQNVSHEFRTPLTLMLGPTEDALAAAEPTLGGEDLETVHRNQLRLLKLVNTLLDFSRIEAGRGQALYEPTDLGPLTRELASFFESAVERAGLELDIRCEALPEPVYVEHDMWEKVVFNLLSNALKFTLAGRIEVELRAEAAGARLRVRDTGVGIPPGDIAHIFERFRRVGGPPGRTQEGTGIGLALVRELVKLHGGTIEVDGRPGGGTTFTVTLPFGAAHLPADRIGSPRPHAAAGLAAAPYLSEVRSWLPDGIAADAPAGPEAAPARARVLIVEDNADMRAYLTRVLGKQWHIESVSDGRAALLSARRAAPDLVLTDVMMPGLDGFELIQALRADPATASVPIIVLSARAGEEAAAQGLLSGADDYLVKPFTASALLVRVESQLAAARARRDAQARVEEERRAAEQARAEAERAKADAEAANRAKDEFLAMLGHELRNPLSPILTALQIMRLRGHRESERERAIIERQVHNLVRLIDDLLDISRITQGKVALKRQLVETAEIVATAIETASPRLEERQHQLIVEVPRTGLVVDGDPARLAQAVGNVLTNAAKYTEPRGRITLRAARDGHEVVLDVIDTGVGIVPEMLPRIFDVFAQDRQTLDRAQGGLGLGLAIVRSLVELHGGSVGVASGGRGLGSRFTLRLPLATHAPAAAAAPARPASPAASGSGRGLALVVDDNGDAAAMLAAFIEVIGFESRVAHDGPAALRMIEQGFLPSLALLDLGLPVMDGYELGRRLRAQPRLRGVRLLAVTGYGQETDVSRTRQAGFDGHVVKPVDLEQLGALIDQLIGGREAGAS